MTPDTSPGPGLLDVAAAAAYTSTSVPFIRRLVRERRVTYVKVGRYVRFDPADLDTFLAAGRVPAAHTTT
jgi:excisionase family DNA binding protein